MIEPNTKHLFETDYRGVTWCQKCGKIKGTCGDCIK